MPLNACIELLSTANWQMAGNWPAIHGDIYGQIVIINNAPKHRVIKSEGEYIPIDIQ